MTQASSPSAGTMVCPKCRGSMRAYERSGVTVDQCEECRGIFLDRGELERLVDVEAQPVGAPPQTPGYPAQPPPPGYPQQGYPQQYPPGRPRGLFDSLFGESHHEYRRGHH